MKYSYKGINKKGEKVSGVVETADKDEAMMMLYDKGITPESVQQSSSIDLVKNYIEELNRKYYTVKLEELIVFTRQFSSLFAAGIPVITILKRLQTQSISAKLKDVLFKIVNDIEAGSPLSIAFNKHKDVFSPLYINMIRVGEEGGVLDIVLNRLTSILETDLETKNRIKTATRYPKLVIFSIIAAFGILITFVIPKFVGLFSKFKADLPLPTKILIWINSFFHTFWWLILILVIAGVYFFKKYKESEKGKYQIDLYVFKIPVIGKLVHKIIISRVTRILGLLYKSGISIITSFDIVSEVSNNEIIKDQLLEIKERVSRGTSISTAFSLSEYFPPVVSDMISAGEETGLLDEMLFKISDYYDEEIDYAIKNLSTAIEPILLVFIAGMVLLLALGVFLPMWDMIRVFK